MDQKAYGFTIVELLIVIVVIGILAAISVVAYRNISTRANHATVSSTVSQAAKKIDSYAVEHGAPPLTLADVAMEEVTKDVLLDYILDTASSPATWCISGFRRDIQYYQNSSDRKLEEGTCIPGLLAAVSSQDTIGGVRTIVFVGDPSDVTSHYAFDFRPSASVYAYMSSATHAMNTGAGVSASTQGGLAVVHYTSALPYQVHIGRRYSLNETWRAPFRAEVYSEALTSAQINAVVERLKAEL